MPQYNRSATSYQKLKGGLASGKLKDAKLTASFNVVVPKEISRKRVDKFLEESQAAAAAAFKKFIKKELEKAAEKEEDIHGKT